MGELTVRHDKQKIRQEGPFLISREDGRLHLCFSQEEGIKVPEGVRSIASGTFTKELCPNLKHLILPDFGRMMRFLCNIKLGRYGKKEE